MATIRPNDNAPAEEVKYIFSADTFDLAPGGSYETDDRDTLGGAETHPWLEVEYPTADEPAVTSESGSVAPEDDRLANQTPDAFDPEKVAAAEAEKAAANTSPLAVEAGLDQTQPVTTGVPGHEVDLTLAAADGSNDDKPRAKRGGKEN